MADRGNQKNECEELQEKKRSKRNMDWRGGGSRGNDKGGEGRKTIEMLKKASK